MILVVETEENVGILPIEISLSRGFSFGRPMEQLGTLGKIEEKKQLIEKVKQNLEKLTETTV